MQLACCAHSRAARSLTLARIRPTTRRNEAVLEHQQDTDYVKPVVAEDEPERKGKRAKRVATNDNAGELNI